MTRGDGGGGAVAAADAAAAGVAGTRKVPGSRTHLAGGRRSCGGECGVVAAGAAGAVGSVAGGVAERVAVGVFWHKGAPTTFSSVSSAAFPVLESASLTRSFSFPALPIPEKINK